MANEVLVDKLKYTFAVSNSTDAVNYATGIAVDKLFVNAVYSNDVDAGLRNLSLTVDKLYVTAVYRLTPSPTVRSFIPALI